MEESIESTSTSHEAREESPLRADDICVAHTSFLGERNEDLPFCEGEHITIIRPSEVLFWYEAKNSQGQVGLVPRTHLSQITDYLLMNPANPATGQVIHMPRISALNEENLNNVLHPTGAVQLEVIRLQEKEKIRRLLPGTLVIGTCPFVGDEYGDLPFNVYEEMCILQPMQDLCWYFAQKTEHPDEKGVIPVTHVRLVYMSDDDDDDGIYKAPTKPIHDCLYDDINDFIGQSGWFSHAGLAHGKTALQHILAKKAGLPFENLASVKKAVYSLNYRKGEKVFVGGASTLSDSLCSHFEHFAKPRDELREVDDEICHHTKSSEWDISVWELQECNLEVETAKKIVELDALYSKECVKGLTESMTFSSIVSFDEFWDWFSPK